MWYGSLVNVLVLGQVPCGVAQVAPRHAFWRARVKLRAGASTVDGESAEVTIWE